MLQVGTLKWKAVFHTRPCASCTRKVTTCVSTSAATVVIKRSKSKCTMAGAFTSALASHGKTEWPPVTRFGGREKRRTGEWANLPHSRVHPPTNDPLLWVIDHTYELAKYVFVTRHRLLGIRRRRCSRDELQTPCALAFRRPRFRNR